jgi:hypothetical protein
MCPEIRPCLEKLKMELLPVNLAVFENHQQRGADRVLLFSATFLILLLLDDLFETANYKKWQNYE